MKYSIKLRVGYSAGVQESYIIERGIAEEDLDTSLTLLENELTLALLGNNVDTAPDDPTFTSMRNGDILQLEISHPTEIVYINMLNVTSIHLCVIGASDV